MNFNFSNTPTESIKAQIFEIESLGCPEALQEKLQALWDELKAR